MKVNFNVIFFAILMAFIPRFPPLFFWSKTVFLPVMILALTSLLYIIVKRRIMINLEVFVIYVSYSIFLFNYLWGNRELNHSVFVLFTLLVLFLLGMGWIRLSVESFFFRKHSTLTAIIVLFFLSIIPISIVFQFLYPQIFSVYKLIVVYPDKFIELNEVGGRYSGLMDATGTSGSVIISILFLFSFVYICSLNCFKGFVFPVFLVFYFSFLLLASFLTGFSGNVILFLFFLFFCFFSAKNKLSFIFFTLPLTLVVMFFLMLIMSLFFSSTALTYFNVLYYQGFEAFLNLGSMKVLLSFYDVASYNLQAALELGGWLGNPEAKSFIQFTDIGYINMINVYGLVGFLNFHALLFLLIFINAYQCFKSESLLLIVLNCALLSLLFSIIILQFKELFYFSSSLFVVVCFLISVKFFAARNINNYNFLSTSD